MNSVSNDNNVKSIKRQNSRKVIPDENFTFIDHLEYDDDYNKCYCFSLSCIIMMIIVIVLLVLFA